MAAEENSDSGGFDMLNELLNEKDLKSLSEEGIAKLNTYFKSLKDAHEAERVEVEKQQINYDQQAFELEKQLIESQEKLKSEASTVGELQKKNETLQTELNTFTNRVSSLEETLKKNETELKDVTRSRDIVATEKKDLDDFVQKRNRELERLNAEWKSMSEQLEAANTAKYEALVKVEQLKSKEATIEYKEKRLQEDREYLNRQIESLKADVSDKNEQLINMRRDQTNKVVETQLCLQDKIVEAKQLQDSNADLKKTLETRSKQVEELTERLKEVRESEAKIQEQFRLELQSSRKLCDLYKESSEEKEATNKELLSAVKELQDLLKKASSDAKAQEEKTAEAHNKLREEMKIKDVKVDALEKELSAANDLLTSIKSKALTDEGVASLSPSAAAASKVVKSGMTLTQIYSEYVKLHEQNILLQEQNKRNENYIDHILKEIEERAPILTRQRQEYERSVTTIDNLTHQLNKAFEEMETLRFQADDASRRFTFLTNDNNKFKEQVQDLGLQVRVLLKEVEEARGGKVITGREEMDAEFSRSDLSSSSKVISQKLVTFRSIEELQQKNEHLLATIRMLSEEKEKNEKEMKESVVAENKEQIENLQKTIETLKSSRERQTHIMENMSRQRDMYKVLLSQQSTTKMDFNVLTSTPAPGKSAPPLTSPTSPHEEKQLAQSKAALTQLQKEFETYRQERRENDNMVQAQLEKAREDNSQLRSQKAKLEAKVEFNNERFKTLNSNIESYRRQIKSLEDKNKNFSASVIKHEQTIATIREEIQKTQERLHRAEASLQSVTDERNILKQAEVRLLKEKESTDREARSQALLMANLESIKNNLERRENEEKAKLENKIQSVERECNALRRKCDQEQDHHNSALQTFQKENSELKNKLEQELSKHAATKSQLESVSSNVSDLQRQVTEVEAKLKTAEARLLTGKPSPLRSASEIDASLKVKDLETQREKCLQEIESLKRQLAEAKQHTEQFKNIAQGVEKELQESNQVNEKFKEELEARLKEKEEERKQKEEKVDALTEENKKLESKLERIDQEIQKELDAAKKNLGEAEVTIKELLATASTSKKELEDAKVQFEEANEKYERELVLHANDMEKLTALKEQVEKHKEELRKVEEERDTAANKLKEMEKNWNVREELLQREQTATSDQNKSLQEQNGLLHAQLETLSAKMATVQQESKPVTEVKEEQKSAKQLLDVIKYLRKQNEIGQSKNDVLETESTRLKAQHESMEKRVDDAENRLKELNNKQQSTMMSSMQHEELLRKVELMSTLTDTNRLLREEKESLEKRLQELEKQNKVLDSKVEKEFVPLQEKTRELTMKNETLTTENMALKADATRWRQRANALIERSNKPTPEDIKKMTAEKENLQKQLNFSQEELRKKGTEITSLNTRLTKSGEELRKSQTKVTELQTKQSQEVIRLQAENQQMNIEINQKNKELQKLKDSVQQAKDEAAAAAANTLKTTTAELTKKANEITKKTSTITDLQKKLTQVQKIARKYKSASEDLEKNLEEMRKENETLKADAEAAQVPPPPADTVAIEDLQRENTELGENLRVVNEELEKLKKENATLQSTLKTKEDKTRSVMTTAKKKVSQLTQELHKVKEEASQSAEPRIANLQNQLNQAQRETNEALQEKQRLEGEIEVLNTKIASLQKQQKVVGERIVPVSSEPRTANIKPMASAATATPSLRQAHPQQLPVISTRPTPTASIRPLPIGSTTQSSRMVATALPMQSQAQGTITHDSDLGTITTPMIVVQPVYASQQPVAQPSTSDVEPEEGPSGVHIAKVSPRVELVEPTTSSASTHKRLREPEETSTGDVTQVKRPRTSSGVSEPEEVSEEAISTTTHKPIAQATAVSRSPSKTERGTTAAVHPVPRPPPPTVVTVNLDSDEDEQAITEIQLVGEDAEGFEDIDYDEDEQIEDDNREQDDNDDQAIGGDRQEGEDPCVEEQGVASRSVPPMSRRPPTFPRQPQQQPPLTPHFVALPSGSGADEGDDRAVPSTPTLFVRPRDDGFAEAVSSPHIQSTQSSQSSTRFVFGAQPGLGNLASEMMDDTKIDLEDAGTGRSVPTTPSHTSPQEGLEVGVAEAGPSDSSVHMNIDDSSVPQDPSQDIDDIPKVVEVTGRTEDVGQAWEAQSTSTLSEVPGRSQDDSLDWSTLPVAADSTVFKHKTMSGDEGTTSRREDEEPSFLSDTARAEDFLSQESEADPLTTTAEEPTSTRSEEAESHRDGSPSRPARQPIVWDHPPQNPPRRRGAFQGRMRRGQGSQRARRSRGFPRLP